MPHAEQHAMGGPSSPRTNDVAGHTDDVLASGLGVPVGAARIEHGAESGWRRQFGDGDTACTLVVQCAHAGYFGRSPVHVIAEQGGHGDQLGRASGSHRHEEHDTAVPWSWRERSGAY